MFKKFVSLSIAFVMILSMMAVGVVSVNALDPPEYGPVMVTAIKKDVFDAAVFSATGKDLREYMGDVENHTHIYIDVAKDDGDWVRFDWSALTAHNLGADGVFDSVVREYNGYYFIPNGYYDRALASERDGANKIKIYIPNEYLSNSNDDIDLVITDFKYYPYVESTSSSVESVWSDIYSLLGSEDYTTELDLQQSGLVVVNWDSDETPAESVVQNEITQSGNNGQSIVTLDYNTANLRVTVPSVLPVSVDSDNNVTVANNAKIVNHSNGSVDVTACTLNGNSTWSLVDFDTDFTKVPTNTKQYGFELSGYKVPSSGDAFNNQFGVIDGKSELPLTYNANVAIQSEKTNDEDIGSLVFTVAWHK